MKVSFINITCLWRNLIFEFGQKFSCFSDSLFADPKPNSDHICFRPSNIFMVSRHPTKIVHSLNFIVTGVLIAPQEKLTPYLNKKLTGKCEVQFTTPRIVSGEF